MLIQVDAIDASVDARQPVEDTKVKNREMALIKVVADNQ
jgi:hypothetical protein